jgi:hypothetical protein
MLPTANPRGDSLAIACAELSATLAALNPARLPPPRDPLDIALPALTGAGTLNADMLRLLSALYWQSEIEHTGMLLAAEMLADARYELARLPAGSVGRLDAFAQRMRERWITRSQREALFARLFGEGAGVAAQPSAAVNSDFSRLLANLCAALATACQPEMSGAARGPDARLRLCVTALLENLAARNVGAAATAAARIGEQIRNAIEVLKDPGVLAMLGATQPWQTLARLFGDQSPDFGRYLSRAQAGQQVLAGLAALPRLDAIAHFSVTALPCQQAYVWLDASGLRATAVAATP